jgi:uncharacterized membrane-anchored protein
MKINSTTGKLLVAACCAGLGAFVVGLCLGPTIKYFDNLYVTVMILSGSFLIFVLLWTRRAVRRLAASETARKSASTFLWSCIFFSMLSLSFGMAVANFFWFSPHFIWGFVLAFYGALTCVAIYPVHRDAKRLVIAAGPNQIAPLTK